MNTVHTVISQHPQEDKKVFQLELITNTQSSDKHGFVMSLTVINNYNLTLTILKLYEKHICRMNY